ncbi:hypothetical protein ACER0C_023747 [Sarotherodon galilaeus]
MELPARAAGLTQAKRFVPSTATAISTNRVITCDGHLVQHLGCESGVIVVESVEYRCGQQEQSSQHDKLKVIKKSCDGKKTCDIDIQIFGTLDPGTCKSLDITFACFPADEGEVSVVYWADYGRRDTTTCSQNVSCNGKSSCTIEASNTEFGDPCPGTYKYLEVAYDCPYEGHVIVVLSAEYGRNDSTTCSYKRPPAQLKNTQCSISTSKVAESCNGRNSCSIKVRNSVFGDPCPGTYKYLDVVYDCETQASCSLQTGL